jgi:branched-subunit amino acid ABC-type transport system permease component
MLVIRAATCGFAAGAAMSTEPSPRKSAAGESGFSWASNIALVIACGLAVMGLTVWAHDGDRGPYAILGAATLGCLACLEAAVRHHFRGDRDRSSLLAAVVTVLVLLPGIRLGASPLAIAVSAVLVFGVAYYVLRRLFFEGSRPDDE